MITIFVVTVGLIALAIATPVPNWKAGGMAIPLTRHFSLPDSNGSIDLDEISSHGILVMEKILSSLENYEINTRTMHPFAVKWNESALAPRGASAPLTTYRYNIWMAEISIGTPPKTLNVQIDTGAADMWVLQTGCSGISSNRDLWNPLESESAKNQKIPFQFKYGDGTIVEGNRYSDNVTISGLTASFQIIGSVTSYTSKVKNNGNADGLLGLAFPSVSKFGADPLFESLVRQSGLLNPTFSLKLSSSGAEMYVGGANSMLYNGEIAYIRVKNNGLWEVTMDDVIVNGYKILENIPAIFDTGAAYIFGDWDRVSELYGRLGGTLEERYGFGFYHLPCLSFPTLSFTFGGKSFAIPPEVLRLKPIARGSPNCFGAIVAKHPPSVFWIIGVTFLQGVYSVFDYGASQVGFAQLA